MRRNYLPLFILMVENKTRIICWIILIIVNKSGREKKNGEG